MLPGTLKLELVVTPLEVPSRKELRLEDMALEPVGLLELELSLDMELVLELDDEVVLPLRDKSIEE